MPPPEAAGFVVQPPLHYSGNVLSISQSSRSSDGYLSQADFIRFYDMQGDIEAQLSDYVPLAGATMTGFLTLSGNPLSTYHAATKNYVDTKINDAIAAIPAGGVTSFNSRQGAVVPVSTDYAAFYADIAHSHLLFDTTRPGFVPQPLVADTAKFLRGDATWAAVAAGVDTAANYTWTGVHRFTNKKFVYATYIQSNSIPGDPADGVLQCSGMSLLQLYSPNQIKISGQSLDISANITTATLQFLHPTEIEFGMSTEPPGNAACLLHYSAFDTSFQQQDSYRLFGSGRHYFNAPKATTDNAVAAVTIWASNARMWSFANALHCYGPALFTGPITLPGNPTLPLHAATKGYVDSHSSSIDLAANYAWTGAHTFAQQISVANALNFSTNPCGVTGLYNTGQPAAFLQIWTNNTMYIGNYGGPDGTTSGCKTVIRAGRGNEGSLGSCVIDGTNGLWTHYGTISMANATIYLGNNPLVYPNEVTPKRYVDIGGAGAILATYAATFLTDCTLGKYFRIPLTGNLTLAAPTGAVDGQVVTWEFVQDTAGNHTVTLNSVFVAGDGGGFTVTLAPNARSYFVGSYHASLAKWDIVAASGGYL